MIHTGLLLDTSVGEFILSNELVPEFILSLIIELYSTNVEIIIAV